MRVQTVASMICISLRRFEGSVNQHGARVCKNYFTLYNFLKLKPTLQILKLIAGAVTYQCGKVTEGPRPVIFI